MRDLAILLVHLPTTIARPIRPGGARAIIAESLLVKHQLLVLNRSRHRAPNLRPTDRIIAGLCALFMRPARLIRSAIVIKPSTILAFHKALVQRKYRLLFSAKRHRKPGPKGPSVELVAAIVEMKRRNPRFGCRRIAQQISFTFGVGVDKDTVRRVLAQHFRPEPHSGDPSWLFFLGHTKDSLWSVDLCRCESLILKTHWVMVVMDHYTRRIIGFAVQTGVLDGPTVCRMFNSIVVSAGLPQYLSSDNDPLFHFHRWKANLRILEVAEIKTVPGVPLSHPFIERLIGTVRREFLEHVPFWNARDLERKLQHFRDYYNGSRAHYALDGVTPNEKGGHRIRGLVDLHSPYRWQSHCRDLFQLPVAA
jgi:putative transposase